MFRLFINFIAALLTLLCAAGLTPTVAQERIYEMDVCNAGPCVGYQMPLAVSEVRNLQNQHWWQDLEIEVKNISNKPIYYIRFGVSLPDSVGFNGNSWGIFMRYGRPALVSLKERLEAEDIPLKPGEVHVFKIPEIVWLTFSQRTEAESRRVLLRIDTINFGNGTGVVAGGEPASN